MLSGEDAASSPCGAHRDGRKDIQAAQAGRAVDIPATYANLPGIAVFRRGQSPFYEGMNIDNRREESE